MSCGKHWTDCYCCLKKKTGSMLRFVGCRSICPLCNLKCSMWNHCYPLTSVAKFYWSMTPSQINTKWTLIYFYSSKFFLPRLPGSASFRWPKIVYSCTHEHDWGSEIFLFVRLVSFRCSAEGLELCSFRLFYHSLLIIKTCISAVNDVRDLSQRRHAVKNQYSYLEDVLNFLF